MLFKLHSFDAFGDTVGVFGEIVFVVENSCRYNIDLGSSYSFSHSFRCCISNAVHTLYTKISSFTRSVILSLSYGKTMEFRAVECLSSSVCLILWTKIWSIFVSSDVQCRISFLRYHSFFYIDMNFNSRARECVSLILLPFRQCGDNVAAKFLIQIWLYLFE